MDKNKLHNAIVGGLRQAIDEHGPITKDRIGSAAKRIVGNILAYISREKNSNESKHSSVR